MKIFIWKSLSNQVYKIILIDNFKVNVKFSLFIYLFIHIATAIKKNQ